MTKLFALFFMLFSKLGIFLKFAKFGKTFISMFFMIVTYALFYGWKFAVGFVLLIFLHEMGHVIAARQVGIPTSAPMFIPFVGAFITPGRASMSAREEFVMAAGGPALGIAASYGCYLIGTTFDLELMIALAYTGLVMNLFNLIPFGFMDGGRMASTLSVWMWGFGLVAFLGLVIVSGNPLLFLFFLMGAYQMYSVYRSPYQFEQIRAYGSERTLFASVYIGMILVAGWGAYESFQALQLLKGGLLGNNSI
ncbi:site-2 protease family protein [Heliophilum fasciatum]|uniref:Zn-dependent protease n=1 Tax=Heliophilum fasciatum TaxID=35700 RepID=A0A4R2RIU0_9FIRM|nr:site-2 protease family protein [Heliophilum fasciatum]MCW2278381.1 Zn-dependent protease [Heliophilum fasciatum]TCP63720.1 Zn-dependent protease [Heliophilum fasciatum]